MIGGHALKRLGMTLSALGFLWACAATVYLVGGAGDRGVSSGSALAAGEAAAGHLPVALLSSKGPWLVGLLLLVTLLAGIPLGLALTQAKAHRTVTWITAVTLLGFSLISGVSVGLMYLPVGFVLLASAALAERRPA